MMTFVELWTQVSPETTRADQPSAFDSRSFLAARSSRAIPSSPSSSVALRWASCQAGTAFSISRFPWGVSRNGWVRASSAGTTSSQPLARIRSTLRLSVDVSRCRMSQTLAGWARPSLAVTTRMFNWLTLRPSGRRASSYRLVTTRFKSRSRTAMQVRAMASMARLLFSLSMFLRPPFLFVYAIIGKVKGPCSENRRKPEEGRRASPPEQGLLGCRILLLLFVFQAVRAVPRRWRLDGVRTSLAAYGAMVTFAFDGGFGACLLAGSEKVRHRYPINDLAT